jgi:single-strand DNA-binding protein
VPADLNKIVLICRHTRDPELRSLPSGMSVCSCRVAFSTRRKDPATGEWGEKSNYIDVTIWGRQGEIVAKYMAKGRQMGVDGRLEWREYQDQQGNTRQAYEIVADNVQFLDGPDDGQRQQQQSFQPRSDVPADVPVAAGAPAQEGWQQGPTGDRVPDDDIPF